MKKAVYAGSFDPVTMGHLWIIEQAVTMFDQVVVTIGENVEKEYTFPIDIRLHLLKAITNKFTNVKVTRFHNQYLINYTKSIGAQYIIRGIRNSNDYEYEKSIRYINSDICPDINTIFLIPPRDVAEVSSSLVKGLVGSKGWEEVVGKYAPAPVVQVLLDWEKNK